MHCALYERFMNRFVYKHIHMRLHASRVGSYDCYPKVLRKTLLSSCRYVSLVLRIEYVRSAPGIC